MASILIQHKDLHTNLEALNTIILFLLHVKVEPKSFEGSSGELEPDLNHELIHHNMCKINFREEMETSRGLSWTAQHKVKSTVNACKHANVTLQRPFTS